jgi:hypothetical protein
MPSVPLRHLAAAAAEGVEAMTPAVLLAKALRRVEPYIVGPETLTSRERMVMERLLKPKRKATPRPKPKRDVGVLRDAVMARDGGKCVVCGDPATDMHHCISGSGMRRQHESVATCASVCRQHHNLAHRGSFCTLESLHLWAQGMAYTVADEALIRRLDKIRAREAGR